MPQRLQRSRRKGAKMPAGAVYVGRPTKWGNPYRVDVATALVAGDGMIVKNGTTRRICVELFKDYLRNTEAGRRVADQAKRELAGKDLVCWCPLDRPCHADVLLEIANAKE